MLDPRSVSFVGPAAALPMRYGLTIGELGRWFVGEMGLSVDLTVVPMRGWRRDLWFDQTGIEWVNPSPNLRSLSAATVYPGTVLFEGTSLSEGRGTDRPFEWIGAPGIDAEAWAARLNAAGLRGVHFVAATRTPSSSKHANQECNGVLLDIVDRRKLEPMSTAVTMLATAPPFTFMPDTFDRLAGTDRLRLALTAGTPPKDITPPGIPP